MTPFICRQWIQRQKKTTLQRVSNDDEMAAAAPPNRIQKDA
jgi:hypothetical protein